MKTTKFFSIFFSKWSLLLTVVDCCRSPEKAKIKQKMVYASSKDALKKALGEGVAKEVQANDNGDLAWSNILEILTK